MNSEETMLQAIRNAKTIDNIRNVVEEWRKKDRFWEHTCLGDPGPQNECAWKAMREVSAMLILHDSFTPSETTT